MPAQNDPQGARPFDRGPAQWASAPRSPDFPPPPRGPEPATPAPPRRPSRLRGLLAGLCALLAVLAAPLGLLAATTQRAIDTRDTFVGALAPLASDPAFQDAVAEVATARIDRGIDRIDLSNQITLNDQQLEALALAERLTGTTRDAIVSGIRERLRAAARDAVRASVTSPRFERLWASSLTELHPHLLATLRAEPGAAATVDEAGGITLNLKPLLNDFRARLTQDQPLLARLVPRTDTSFTLIQASEARGLQRAYATLAALARWLPPAAGALALLGLALANSRPRYLTGLGIGAAVTMGLLLLALWALLLPGARSLLASGSASRAIAGLAAYDLLAAVGNAARPIAWWATGGGVALAIGAGLWRAGHRGRTGGQERTDRRGRTSHLVGHA